LSGVISGIGISGRRFPAAEAKLVSTEENSSDYKPERRRLTFLCVEFMA
jgi:hypothetical protein